MAVTETAPRRRVHKPPEERRRELLDAAVKVFTRKGVPDTTIGDITDEAGVGKGTFYLHFSSKDEVLAALRAEFVDAIVQHATPFIERIGLDDWWELADTVVESWVDFTLDNADAIRLVMHQAITPETQDVVAECDRRMEEMLGVGIRAGVDAGAFRSSDPELAGSLIHWAIEGALHAALVYGDGVDRDRFVAACKEFVHKILAP